MNEEMIKKSDEILKEILGREKYRQLLNRTPDILDKKIGKNHSISEGIIITRLVNRFIVHIAYFLSEGKTIEDFEKMCNPKYKKYTHFNSIQEIYESYQEYIDIVKLHYIKKKK